MGLLGEALVGDVEPVSGRDPGAHPCDRGRQRAAVGDHFVIGTGRDPAFPPGFADRLADIAPARYPQPS